MTIYKDMGRVYGNPGANNTREALLSLSEQGQMGDLKYKSVAAITEGWPSIGITTVPWQERRPGKYTQFHLLFNLQSLAGASHLLKPTKSQRVKEPTYLRELREEWKSGGGIQRGPQKLPAQDSVHKQVV